METPTLANLFKRVEQANRDDRAKRRLETLGTLRGGNTGLYEAGEKPSHCVRKAALRSWFALEEDIGYSKDLIFSNGLNSEAKLVEEWQAALDPGQRILTQAECATRWKTSSGILVSGSPDLVVVDRLQRPVYGMELKNCNSVYKAFKVLKEIPGVDALTQAAHYSYQLGKIPWFLVYSSHTQQHNLEAMKWYTGDVVRRENYQHIFDWAERDIKTGRGKDAIVTGRERYAKSLLGFRISFELQWRTTEGEEQVFVRSSGLLPSGGHKANETAGEWHNTVITWKRIKDYYELLASLQNRNAPLPPRPEDLTIDGAASSFNLCLPAYCQFASVCKAAEKGKCNMGGFVDLIEQFKRGQHD